VLRTGRTVWRLTATVVHVLHGLAVMALRFPSLDAAGRQARIGWWAATLLRRLGLRLDAQGLPHRGATLLVANHVSWLDILAVHAVMPQARFVSKADVRAWPLLGWLVAGAGTLFIERERKRDALRVVHTMAEALGQGQTVAVFPEGTTGAGTPLLPFHANLLQAAIATDTPIQAVGLRYDDVTGRCAAAAAYIGDMTLLQSLWAIAGAQDLTVRLRILPPQACGHDDRRALAEQLRGAIQQAVDAA
jgi:1-acyl-sn-glycerol-3-phosphate acyltransferase